MSTSRSSTPAPETVRRCGICFEGFGDVVLPKVLPCGHSFCEGCITRVARNRKIICPTCRDEHDVPNGGFPTNYQLQDVLAAEEGHPEHATPAPPATVFQILVRNVTGNHITFLVESGYTVEQLNYMVRDRVGIHPFQQRLIYGGKQLQEGQTLGFYNIRKDSTVDLTLRLLGGIGNGADGYVEDGPRSLA